MIVCDRVTCPPSHATTHTRPQRTSRPSNRSTLRIAKPNVPPRTCVYISSADDPSEPLSPEPKAPDKPSRHVNFPPQINPPIPILSALPSSTRTQTDQKPLDILLVRKLHAQRWTIRTPYHLSTCLNYTQTHHKRHTPPSPHSEPTVGLVQSTVLTVLYEVHPHTFARRVRARYCCIACNTPSHTSPASAVVLSLPIRSPPPRTSHQEPTTPMGHH